MREAKRELPSSSNSKQLGIWDKDICLHLVKVVITSLNNYLSSRPGSFLKGDLGHILNGLKSRNRHNHRPVQILESIDCDYVVAG